MRKALGVKEVPRAKAVDRLLSAKSICVIEPHVDDCFISLGWHIENLWKDKDVTILSVHCDDKRSKEAKAYASKVGAVSACLGLEQGKEVVCKPYFWDKFDVVLFPIGLQHPDHLRVRNLAPNDAMFYLDTPYQSKQMNAQALAEAVVGRTLVSIAYPHKRKWRHKEIFKSQSKFFHFNPMQDYKIPEIIVS